MPQWGLTQEQRKTRPWDLPEEVLQPGKVVTDPVHGDIHLNWLEVAITDSGSYQRLRRVRQLGTTHLVYPGATHTRFSHSLGAVHVAQQLLDQVITQREGLHAVPDLLGQWSDEERPGHIARVITLARLGALLHDLCHVPVGHSVEDDLKVLTAHDENDARFQRLWGGVRATVREAIEERWEDDARGKRFAKDLADQVDQVLFEEEGELFRELEPLVISKRRKDGEAREPKPPEEMQYPFVADLVGNTICADLLDYLIRDHLFAGLPASLGDRFISAFFVVPRDSGVYSQRMALNIRRQEHERSDIVSELLKALRYRYELTERALYHHAKLAADAMLGEALERWSGALWLQEAAPKLMSVPDHEAPLAGGQVYRLKRMLKDDNETVAEAVDKKVEELLEDQFVTHGDDGLLEKMSMLDQTEVAAGPTEETTRRLLAHSAQLSRGLLDRKLFRIAARIGYKDASAEKLFDVFGKDPAKRDELERGAETYAELGRGSDDTEFTAPRVVIWLPPTDMRLKFARVLVQHKAGITPFNEYEESRAHRGSDIYEAHRRLWSCFVFVRRDVSKAEEEVVTTFLAREMGVRWERHDHFGAHPDEWPTRLAIHRQFGWPAAGETRTDDRLKEFRKDLVAAREASKTFSGLRARVESFRKPEDGTPPKH